MADPPGPARPRIGRARRLLKSLGYGLAFAVPVTALAFLVREKFRPVIELDERLIVAATDITRDDPGLRSTLLGWQEATQPKWVYIVASAVCLVLWRRHRELRSRCLWAFVTMMVAWNLQLVLKEVVRRARPIVSDPVSHAPGYGFPSGHVANAAAIATVMTLLLWPLLSPVARRWLIGALMAYVLLTALDRVFLGVHFPSDVVAGILFGLGLGTASYLGYLGWNPMVRTSPLRRRGDAGPESPEGST